MIEKTDIVHGLQPGTTYKFVVQSRNIINFSDVSSTTQVLAAQITTKPTNLVNVPEITLADRIGLSWTTPSFNGGSSLVDYQLQYDNANGGIEFFVLEASILTESYTAMSLTQGSTY